MEKAAGRVKAACGIARIARIAIGMAEKDQDRAERLAESLRANLRRRKQQARALDVKAPTDRTQRDCPPD